MSLDLPILPIVNAVDKRWRDVVAAQAVNEKIAGRFFKGFNPTPGDEELTADDPVKVFFHRIEHLIAPYYGERAFQSFLWKAATGYRSIKGSDSLQDPLMLEPFITGAVDAYNAQIPHLSLQDLKLIGYGSRVQVRFLNQVRAARIPHERHRDPDENRDFTHMQRLLPEFLPDPKIETLIIDGHERHLVTVKFIPQKISLQTPSSTLPRIIKNESESNPDFFENAKKQVSRFIEACKECYKQTLSLPDLAGRENVVLDRHGNIYLIDMNNSFVTDIYSLIHDAEEHPHLTHITQQVMLFSETGSSQRLVYDHTTSPEAIEGKVIIPIDDKAWPAFDGSLQFLFKLEHFFQCWDSATGQIDENRQSAVTDQLLDEEFYRPLRSTRRSRFVESIIEQYRKKNV